MESNTRLDGVIDALGTVLAAAPSRERGNQPRQFRNLRHDTRRHSVNCETVIRRKMSER